MQSLLLTAAPAAALAVAPAAKAAKLLTVDTFELNFKYMPHCSGSSLKGVFTGVATHSNGP
jgi:hypothetical protein